MRLHDLPHFRAVAIGAGRGWHFEIFHRHRRLQLQIQLLFNLPDRREIFIEARTVARADFAHQLFPVIGHQRQDAAPRHDAGVRLEVDRIGVLKPFAKNAPIQRIRRCLAGIGRTGGLIGIGFF